MSGRETRSAARLLFSALANAAPAPQNAMLRGGFLWVNGHRIGQPCLAVHKRPNRNFGQTKSGLVEDAPVDHRNGSDHDPSLCGESSIGYCRDCTRP
jgi:hypothetical protein